MLSFGAGVCSPEDTEKCLVFLYLTFKLFTAFILRYSLQLTESELVLSFGAGVCSPEDTEKCLVFLYLTLDYLPYIYPQIQATTDRIRTCAEFWCWCMFSGGYREVSGVSIFNFRLFTVYLSSDTSYN